MILAEVKTVKESVKNLILFASGFLILALVCTLFLALNEGNDGIQAWQMTIATMTTVGYGDGNYSKDSTKWFLTFFILLATTYTASAFSEFVGFFSGLQINNNFKRLIPENDDEKAKKVAAVVKKDMNVGGFSLATNKSQFVLYALHKAGSISRTDVAEFRTLYSALAMTDGKTGITMDDVE